MIEDLDDSGTVFEDLPPQGAAQPVEPEPQANPAPAASKPVSAANSYQSLGRIPPHSLEAEQEVIGAMLVDGRETIALARSYQIEPETFYSAANRIIFAAIREIHAREGECDVAMLAEELRARQQLEAVGGFPYLVEITSRVPTTAQATYFIGRIRELWTLRELIATSLRTIETAYSTNGEVPEFLHGVRQQVDRITGLASDPFALKARSLMDFELPKAGDHSILLGDRYLNRGDGMILTSTSGMGKSSMTIQAALSWALGRDFFGIKPNGPLKSLIIQSEDSDGDVAEVRLSLAHAMALTPEEIKAVGERVKLVTDRVHRGPAFIKELRRQIDEHKPDIVWINPLLAFIGGDVNEAKEAGEFLRDGLNSLNEPPRFGYVVVHHTAKPPQGDNAKDRKWSEVMYDMAGSADLTNWARAIISLRPTEQEGEFNLILAKRGRRAGVVKQVEQGAGFRYEAVTTIPLKHSSESIEIDERKLHLIHWVPGVEVEKKKPGAPKKHLFGNFRSVFPVEREKAITFNQLYKRAATKQPISKNTFWKLVEEAVEDGMVSADRSFENEPKYYCSGSLDSGGK